MLVAATVPCRSGWMWMRRVSGDVFSVEAGVLSEFGDDVVALRGGKFIAKEQRGVVVDIRQRFDFIDTARSVFPVQSLIRVYCGTRRSPQYVGRNKHVRQIVAAHEADVLKSSAVEKQDQGRSGRGCIFPAEERKAGGARGAVGLAGENFGAAQRSLREV